MADKQNSTIVGKEAQSAWAKCKSADEKTAAVKQFPELRHLFAQALDIFNHLEPDKTAEPSEKT